MNIEPQFEADSQLAESGKPRVSPLDHPAVTPKAVFALDAFAGDSSRDAASAQITAASTAVVTLVGMQFVRALAWSPSEARHGRNCIQRRLEGHRIMAIRSRHGNRQRDTLRIDDDVSLAA